MVRKTAAWFFRNASAASPSSHLIRALIIKGGRWPWRAIAYLYSISSATSNLRGHELRTSIEASSSIRSERDAFTPGTLISSPSWDITQVRGHAVADCQRSVTGLSRRMMGETILVAVHHDIVRTRQPAVMMPSVFGRAHGRASPMGF